MRWLSARGSRETRYRLRARWVSSRSMPARACESPAHRSLNTRIHESMRSRTWRYFWGMLFSRMSIYAYGIAGSITTALQLVFLVLEGVNLSSIPQRTQVLPAFVELWIETLLPFWIGEITTYNFVIVGFNIFIALTFLLLWTDRYSRTF